MELKRRHNDYYVGQITESTTVDKLKQFTHDNGVELVSCFQLQSRIPQTVAFKIKCSDVYKDKVLEPEFWPNNVIIRQWVKKKEVLLR